MFEGYPDILTVEEACQALRIGYNAIYELLNSGKLKGFHNGRVWRIPKLACENFILVSSGLKEPDSVDPMVFDEKKKYARTKKSKKTT